MALLTNNRVHYTKFDIKNWTGPTERVEINQSLSIADISKQQYFKWKFTQQRREWKNSVIGAEDESWEGWEVAIEKWDSLREEFGRDIKLWIGKPCYKNLWIPGKRSTVSRLHYGVGILQYIPAIDEIKITVIIEEWVDHFMFVDNPNSKMFNKTSSWKNPTTVKVGTGKKGDW